MSPTGLMVYLIEDARSFRANDIPIKAPWQVHPLQSVMS